MKRVIVYGALGVFIFVAATTMIAPVRDRVRGIATDVKLISADTGDVMASASYQRYALRRKAVEGMRTALRKLVVAESAFVADSGRPTVNFWQGRYGFAIDPANQIYVNIQRDRWVAQARNNHTSMSCSLTALLDTTTEPIRYHAGEPVCAEWNAESIAVAQRAPPSSPPPAVSSVPPPAQPEPHKHLDWGPVNNTSPRMPFIVRESCEGEGCTYRGTWAACSTVVARTDKRLDAAPVFTIQARDRFTALTADVHVVEPGIVVFRHPYTTTVPIDEAGLVDITFTPADTLFVLNDLGEGVVVWRFRGSTMRGDIFWDPSEPPTAADTFALVRAPKTIWWVRVRNAAGREGWIVGDYARMATGGYMDEIERCAH